MRHVSLFFENSQYAMKYMYIQNEFDFALNTA